MTLTHLVGIGVCRWVSVCPHDNLKTIADICFLLDSRKISEVRISRSEVKVKVIFSEGSKVYDFLLGMAGSEIPPPMASFFSFRTAIINFDAHPSFRMVPV